MFPAFQTFPEGQIVAFGLIFLRCVAFVIAWPIFGNDNVPIQLKILLSILLAALLMPILPYQDADKIIVSNEMIMLAIKEVIAGLLIGYLTRLFFFAVSVAGEIISISMGVSSAQLFNPLLGTNSNVVEQFHLTLATIFFLGINGHHIFLTGLAKSFEVLPLAAMGIQYQGFAEVATFAEDILLMGLKISAPVMLSVFVANIAMGILGRAVPQINVLVTSIPVTILIGFAVMFVGVPLYLSSMSGLLDLMSVKLMLAMKGF